MITQIASTFHGGKVEVLLKGGNGVRIAPQGTSMWPTILPGRDKVEVQPVERRIRRGDVVLYRRPSGILVLHRVVKIHEDRLWFCGDNQFEVEGPLPASCVLGVMSARIRGNKHIETDSLRWRAWSATWRIALPARKFVRTIRLRRKKR